MTERVTNEVIVERLEGIKLLFHEQFTNVNSKLNSIEAQTTKTNGRVTVLEDKVEKNREGLDKRISSNRDVISKIIGAVIVINLVIGIAVTLTLKFF